MDKFVLIVAGSRDFKDYSMLEDKLDILLSKKVKTHKIVIRHGDAKGADSLADKYARIRGYEVQKYPAKWKDLKASPCVIKQRPNGEKYNSKAGTNRNIEMASNGADGLVVFFEKTRTNGTAHMVKTATQYNIPVREYINK